MSAEEVTSAAGSATHLERLDPAEVGGQLGAQHWARYDWACQFLPAGRVLDCACGMGFGTALLRDSGAETVVGVDVSAEAIGEAERRYARAGVQYMQADALKLDPKSLGRFDRIVSLETLEHVSEPLLLLDLFRELLGPEGVLAVSVPNDTYLGVANPYHLWRAEFATVYAWLCERFKHVTCYAELQVVGTGVFHVDALDAAQEGAGTLRAQRARAVDQVAIETAAGFLFACGQQAVPAVQPVAAQLLAGSEYIRELEQVRDRLWDETQRLAQNTAILQGHAADQARVISIIEQERDVMTAEAQRLARGWEEQKAHIDSQAATIQALEAERNRLMEALQAQGGS